MRLPRQGLEGPL